MDSYSPSNSPGIIARALSIEDNADFARILGHMLKVMGCHAELVSNAQSGLEIAGRTTFDIIFCDIGLNGEMDGLGFARALRASPALAHIPLVAISARIAVKEQKLAWDAGFDRVLEKPVKFGALTEVLADLRNEAGPALRRN